MIARILAAALALSLLATGAFAQFTDQRTYGGGASGSVNVLNVTIPNLDAHLPGVPIRVVATATNTGPATFNPGPSAVAIRKRTASGLVALSGGEIVSGQIYEFVYDGTYYEISGMIFPGATVSRTGAYTASTADCGTIQNLGGSGFYAVTVNAPSLYPDGCVIKFVNGSSSRGRAVAVATLGTTRVFPNIVYTLIQNGGTWAQEQPVNVYVTSGVTLYVNRTLGSDNPDVADCLATGAGACQTINTAISLLTTKIYSPAGATIQLDCDTSYPENVSLVGHVSGTHVVTIRGNPSSPASCVIAPTSGTAISIQDFGGIILTGVQAGFSGGGSGTAVYCRQLAVCDIDNVQFASNTSGTQISVDGASTNITGIISLAGNAALFLQAGYGADVKFIATFSVGSVTNTFWFTGDMASTLYSSVTWSAGTPGGTRYSCARNSVLYFGGVAFPGTLAAGTAGTGCQAP